MKTPEKIIIWCDMMLNRHPNIEDTNFFNSIKDYMKEQRPQGRKLLLCPKCGDSWLFASEYDYGSNYENLGYHGTCKCGFFDKNVSWNKTKNEAIMEWNELVSKFTANERSEEE